MGWQDAPKVVDNAGAAWKAAPAADVPLERRGTGAIADAAHSVDAAVRGAVDAATFGFSDEINAGLHAPVTAAINVLRGKGFDLGAAYNQGLAQDRSVARSDEANRPIARGAGQVAGAILGPGGKLGAAEKLLPRVGGNLAYGAAYGVGSGEGGASNRINEAGRSAVLNAAGGEVGRGAVKALGRVLAPAVARVRADPTQAAKYPHAANVATLADSGVNMTPGQIAGGVGKWLEEAQSSIPIFGYAQRAGQQRANDSFVRGGIDKALSFIGDKLPEGVKGTDAMAHMQRAFDAAYEKARAGMHFAVDNEFANDIGDTLSRAESSPVMGADQVARLGKVQQNLRDALAKTGGNLNGTTLKKIVSDLKRQASALSGGNNNAADQELGSHIGEIVDHIDAAARRNPATDPAAAALMEQADAGYAYAVRLENAAKQRGGEAGTFSATQLDRAVQKGDKTARNRAYSRGDALFQKYADAGKAVLPNRVPNSGTPERAAYLGLLGGGAHFAPGLAAVGALGALPYAPIANRAVAASLMSRPAAVTKAGRKLSQVAAPVGTGAGLLFVNRGS